MPPKRTSDGGGGRNKKRARIFDSRRIIVQNNEDAFKDGRLDVPAFVKSREFEIKQLENSMFNSKRSGSKRAFQKVPRDLRRRTASHNVKRVPQKLRKRATREMAEDKTPSIKKVTPRGHAKAKDMAIERTHQKEKAKKVEAAGESSVEYDSKLHNTDSTGINEWLSLPKGDISYQSRQKSKAWLPTHVWHAKRAHMEPLWGYSIPVRPTAKCYRPTHRASTQTGAVVWDTSYFCTVILHGKEVSISVVLAAIGARRATTPKYTSGKRAWEGLLTNSGDEVLGPGLVYWKRTTDGEADVMLRFHPALFDALSPVVSNAARESGCDFHDCRFSIGSIDICGPKSLAALRAVLKFKSKETSKTPILWTRLSSISNPASIPSNVAINLNVHDPRFFSAKRFKVNPQSPDYLATLLSEWPESFSAPSALFSTEGRNLSYRNQASLKSLNARRSEAGPGKDVPTTPDDPTIPIILIKRSNNSWTLNLPWGWVLPFWHSITEINGIRIGGIEQFQQLAFESGNLDFPKDFVFSPLYSPMAEKKAKELEDHWNRKPSDKRVNYFGLSQLHTGKEHGSPFKCDWGFAGAVYKNRDQLVWSKDISKDIDGLAATVKPVLSRANGAGEAPMEDENTINVSPVKLEFKHHRGHPTDNARIYRFPNDDADWNAIAIGSKQDQDSLKTRPVYDLIGFVSSGTFNLTTGSGYAIGCIISNELKDKTPVLVRNVGTTTFRLAYAKLISV